MPRHWGCKTSTALCRCQARVNDLQGRIPSRASIKKAFLPSSLFITLLLLKPLHLVLRLDLLQLLQPLEHNTNDNKTIVVLGLYNFIKLTCTSLFCSISFLRSQIYKTQKLASPKLHKITVNWQHIDVAACQGLLVVDI